MDSPYEALAKRNTTLAQMTDQCPHYAKLCMKVLLALDIWAEQTGRRVKDIDFEATFRFSDRRILIKILDQKS